jgi:hypothetical protein
MGILRASSTFISGATNGFISFKTSDERRYARGFINYWSRSCGGGNKVMQMYRHRVKRRLVCVLVGVWQ